MSKMNECRLINSVRPLSIQELYEAIDDIGQNGKIEVIDGDRLRPSSVPVLTDLLDKGVAIIMLVSFVNQKIGHYIAIFKKKGTCEIYDPEGGSDDVIRGYLTKYPILGKTMSGCGKIKYIHTPTQPYGSDSCGLWAIMRVANRTMSGEKFISSVQRNCKMETRSMPEMPDQMKVNRNHMREAFGLMSHLKPQMSSSPANRYSRFLEKHTNLSPAAAKHLAILINAGVKTSEKFARQKVEQLAKKIKKKLPKLRMSKWFIRKFGGARCDAFNSYCRQQRPNEKPLEYFMGKDACGCDESRAHWDEDDADYDMQRAVEEVADADQDRRRADDLESDHKGGKKKKKMMKNVGLAQLL